MKNTILFIFFGISFWCQAQVGVNTTSPNALLDIRTSNQAVPTNTDGILIPKINVFPATNPTVAQQGMMVYLTTVSGTNQPGFYYWNQPTITWIPILSGSLPSGTLDKAYDFGGAGLGRTITADAGAVTIAGTDGLVSTGTLAIGAVAPSGAGIKMFWNPRKAAFRAGSAVGTEWDDANIGSSSIAFGFGTTASGDNSTAFGTFATASGILSTAFGSGPTASGLSSTAFGVNTQASGSQSTAFGSLARASGDKSTAFGSSSIASGSQSTAFGVITQAIGSLIFLKKFQQKFILL